MASASNGWIGTATGACRFDVVTESFRPERRPWSPSARPLSEPRAHGEGDGNYQLRWSLLHNNSTSDSDHGRIRSRRFSCLFDAFDAIGRVGFHPAPVDCVSK